VSKAIGNSGNPRYHAALSTVANSDAHKKLRKHAGNALKQVGDASGAQYQKGAVSLAALRDTPAAAKPATAKPAGNGSGSLDLVQVGMSMPEVYDLVGQPTATTSHQTGKAWIPFNYKGGDLMRTIALYKGKGRVIFSHENRYNTTMRVIEVIVDPNETGYP
jgi:hypothetical protein